MEKEPPENDDERYVREMNEAAERDAHFDRVKAQLWRRIAAAMRETPSLALQGPSHLVVTPPAGNSVQVRDGGQETKAFLDRHSPAEGSR